MAEPAADTCSSPDHVHTCTDKYETQMFAATSTASSAGESTAWLAVHCVKGRRHKAVYHHHSAPPCGTAEYT